MATKAGVDTAPGNQQLWLAAVLAVALLIRLAGLNADSFSMDEVTDLLIARLPLRQIVGLPDGFPPLYHILLKGWLAVWQTPLAARWLSALLGVVTVYAVYRLALATVGRRAALVASMLVAISPLHVWFAQESRAYALAIPLAAVTLWLFQHAYSTNTLRDWLVYTLIALAAVCTHYFLAIIIALQALWLLPRVARGGHDYRPALTAYASLLLSGVPVLLLLRSDLAFQSGSGDGSIGLGAPLYALYVYLLGFATGPSLRDLHGLSLREAAAGFLPWIIMVAVCLLPLSIFWLRQVRLGVNELGYLLLMWLGPIAVTVIFSALFHLKFKVSYVAWGSIPMLVMLGEAIAAAWNRWSTRLGVAGYLCLASISLGNRHLANRYRNEDLRSLANYLQTHSSPNAPVYVLVKYMTEPVVFYLGDNWSVRPFPDGPAALNTLAELGRGAPGSRAWLVYTRPFHGDPGGELHARIVSDDRIRLSARFPGVDLYRLDIPQKGRVGS